VRPATVRVSVQLVRTTDGSTTWGDQYDVARGDLLGVEDAVAEDISRALRVQMSEAERERFYRRYTRNGAAYERYLMGRARLRALTEQGAVQAVAEFEAARDLDPSYARVRWVSDGCGADPRSLRLAEWLRGLGRPRPPRSPPRSRAGRRPGRGARGACGGAPLSGVRLGHTVTGASTVTVPFAAAGSQPGSDSERREAALLQLADERA
jgi:hypothetical protein